MEILQIIEYWSNKGYIPYSYSMSQLKNSRLNKQTIEFLNQCGLPSDSAPFLSFYNWEDVPIPTVKNEYNSDVEELSDYLMIGFNGYGDPVCIDLAKGNEIVFLNHDNDFERIFINTDIQRFIQCLMRYTDFIEFTNSSDSSNFINERFDKIEVEKLRLDLYNIDINCLSDNSMWYRELMDK